MKKFFLLNIIIFLTSCGVVKEGFSNNKKNSSDEFLVEKKDPLVMPPDYNELPTPVTQDGQIKEDDSIKDLLIEKDSENLNSNQDLKANKDLEDSLLEKIKKN
jgi:hypothetical protein